MCGSSLTRRLLVTACLALLGGDMTSCGDRRATPAAGSKTAGAPLSIQLRPTRLGRILVDGRGRALYLFIADAAHTSSCYAYCARIWPPVVSDRNPQLAAGLQHSRLTLIARRGSALKQVTYGGHPLYFLARERPGHLDGQDYAHGWFLVSAQGRPVLKPGEHPAKRSSY